LEFIFKNRLKFVPIWYFTPIVLISLNWKAITRYNGGVD